MTTPLYNHTNEATAYLVTDYPYGRLRCKIRYWLERDEKRGYRFVSQTENPKTGVWNKPKKSTYMLVAGCMYLDEKGHVQWSGLSEYSDAEKCLEFVRRFPLANLLDVKIWAIQKQRLCLKMADGSAFMTINGQNVTTEADKERAKKEASQWAVISGSNAQVTA